MKFRSQLAAGTTVISGAEFDSARMCPAPATLVELPMVSSCCERLLVRLALKIIQADGGPLVLNTGNARWDRQRWESPEPHSSTQLPRRGNAEIGRLITFWPRGSRDCWRVAVVNPAGVVPGSQDARELTEPGERTMKVTHAQLVAVLDRFGDFLAFPAHRSPVQRHDADDAEHFDSLANKAESHGFVTDDDMSTSLGLVAFLLRTGSVRYEQVVAAAVNGQRTRVDLPSPLPGQA